MSKLTPKEPMPELKPCPFQIWDKVEVITGENQPSWCNDWEGVTLFVAGVDYNFNKGRYELTVAENIDGQYVTDEMPADCIRLLERPAPDKIVIDRGDAALITIQTLKWWLELVDLNPKDLKPRIEAIIDLYGGNAAQESGE